MAKNPRTPPGPLAREDSDVVSFERPLWRVRATDGPYALPWNVLREYGPVSTMRWDPHPAPVRAHPGVGVGYAAPDLVTVIAEVFQKNRQVKRTGSLELVGWKPTRPLRLLDLTGSWLVRNGASHSLSSGPKSVCRAWSRQIHVTWPDLDGLLAPSTLTGRPMVVLFAPAASAFPVAPAFARLLNDPGADRYLTPAARELGWRIAART